ncbi:hypothetical protein F7725_024633 [Dissostichus mawsoni]|uniref:Ig-like domain-containing protein n=1 Tax=Dissostichus mawsoni TaxID=36200 RepID=A0A7J5X9U3_DISMA|nr:hypothetical protein F7725_024633 [Dissostichus mawsoni]
MDGLYEEYGMVEAILSSSEMEGCHSEERYLKLFSKAEVPLVNLRKVSAYIFSIPCSNAHTERVFSMMTSAWRNERNRLDVDSVKAELHICVNFTFECTDMYQRLLTNKNSWKQPGKGKNFLILDLETESWIAPKPQAVFTKQRWDKDKPLMAYNKYYYTQYCPEYLKKYVNLGRSSLMRTEIPSVSLLQKSPSSPVSCHATGFYPDRAIMFWTEDGEELHDNVDHGEILPNHDGSFQMSVDLNVSSFPAEHWDKYRCVFQLSGVKEDQVIRLDSAVIRTNRGKTASQRLNGY